MLDEILVRAGSFAKASKCAPRALGDASSRAVEAAEHAADRVRLRALGWLPAAVWASFGVGDWVSARFLWHTPLLPYGVLRAIGTSAILGLMWVSRSETSVCTLRRALVAASLLLAATLGAQCGWAGGGLLDDYFYGVVFLPLMSLATPRPLRGALAWNLAVVTMFSATVVATSALTPRNAAQLASPRAWITFGIATTLLLAAALVASKISDATWRLRRQLFASRNLGQYELRARLGGGGMGEVWSAWHPGLRRFAAVKIARSTDDDRFALARFEREVAAASALTHPNAVRVFDYGVTGDGLRWFAMELLHGEDLASLVEREGALSPARAVHLIAQAARALAEAHRRGIVHRDVKPENLFVTSAGEESDFVKVLDFGISRRLGKDDPELTEAGYVAGTPAFMAPEAALGRACDARADVYGLGAVLYFCLTGRPPFEGSSSAAMMLAQIREPPLAAAVRNPQVPRELDALVLAALAKDPARRPADARAFVAALEGCGVERWNARLVDSLPSPDAPPIAPSDSGTIRVGAAHGDERATHDERRVIA